MVFSPSPAAESKSRITESQAGPEFPAADCWQGIPLVFCPTMKSHMSQCVDGDHSFFSEVERKRHLP